MLKRQWFEDNESDKTELSISKRQRLDVHNDKERQGLNKYKNESKGKRYVPFPFITPFLPI